MSSDQTSPRCLEPIGRPALSDASSSDRYEALYVLCLMYGLRQGETPELRWQDVDLEGGTSG